MYVVGYLRRHYYFRIKSAPQASETQPYCLELSIDGKKQSIGSWDRASCTEPRSDRRRLVWSTATIRRDTRFLNPRAQLSSPRRKYCLGLSMSKCRSLTGQEERKPEEEVSTAAAVVVVSSRTALSGHGPEQSFSISRTTHFSRILPGQSFEPLREIV